MRFECRQVIIHTHKSIIFSMISGSENFSLQDRLKQNGHMQSPYSNRRDLRFETRPYETESNPLITKRHSSAGYPNIFDYSTYKTFLI